MIHSSGLSLAVPSAAPQTDNTAAIVGGVTSGVLIFTLIVAMTIIAVVALLRFRCGLPARTSVQYVHNVQIMVMPPSLCAPLCRECVRSVDVSTSGNEVCELVKQAGGRDNGGMGGESGRQGVARGRRGEEEYEYVVVSAPPPAQPVAAGEGVYEHIP